MSTPAKKPGFSVAPSPFNAVKLELAVILVLGVFLLLAVGFITKNLVSQVLMLAGFAMGCLLWLVLRTRSISRRLSDTNKAEPRMDANKREF